MQAPADRGQDLGFQSRHEAGEGRAENSVERAREKGGGGLRPGLLLWDQLRLRLRGGHFP